MHVCSEHAFWKQGLGHQLHHHPAFPNAPQVLEAVCLWGSAVRTSTRLLST